VSLTELRKAVDELGLESSWTLTAEAAQYRATLALEQAMKSVAELKRKWLEQQNTFDVNFVIDSPFRDGFDEESASHLKDQSFTIGPRRPHDGRHIRCGRSTETRNPFKGAAEPAQPGNHAGFEHWIVR
jgi:hypothetical protein